MLDKGINSTAIAKNCGTSTTMIDKHYTANSAIRIYVGFLVTYWTNKTKKSILKFLKWRYGGTGRHADSKSCSARSESSSLSGATKNQ